MLNLRLKKTAAVLLALMLLAGVPALPAVADGSALVGEVTVTHNQSVNLRSGGSTSFPIVGTASPGQLFQTTGQVAGGWYEILMADGSFAYISNTLVYYFPYQTPIPLGSQYTVPVYYRTTQGQTLRTVFAPLRAGQNIISADDSQVPGYRLISARSVYVTLGSNGLPVPSGVIFTYEPGYLQPTPPPVMAATVPVNYRNVFNQVLATETRTLTPGAHLVRADLSKVPAGYSLSGATDAVVVVSTSGTAAPSAVNFLLSQSSAATPRPTSAVVSISYRDETGNVLHTASQTVPPGYATITANDSLVPAGMTLTSSRSVMVFVSDQGVSYPSGVIFTYKRPSQASVQVVYADAAGRPLFSETRNLPQGTHIVTADDSKVPRGYVLQSARSVTVNVYSGSYATPGQVLFTYAVPVNVNIGIEYRDTDGRTLHSESRSFSTGTYTISADDGRVPSGYTLQGARSAQVTVYSNGTASTYRVVFVYSRPVSANISIRYEDIYGNVLFTETRSLSQGSHTLSANDGRAPAGFVLVSQRSVQVTVYSNGGISPSEVVFTYAPPGPPVSVTVPVTYQDENGIILYQTTVTVESGQPMEVRAFGSNVPGYKLISRPASVTVTVTPNGVANPSHVVFTFSRSTTPPKPPVSVNIPVIYQAENGAILYQSTVTAESGQSLEVKAFGSHVPGYKLVSRSPVTVTVSPDGMANPPQVIFTFRGSAPPPGPAVTVNVPVYYKEENGATLFQTTVPVSSDQPVEVKAFGTYVPAGYALVSRSPITVTAKPDGTTNPSHVVFTYRAPGPGPGPQPQPGGKIPILPAYQNFSYSGKAVAVYTGPGTNYLRANSGKANLGGGRVRVWGLDGKWALIGYGLSNNLYRVGYVPANTVPANVKLHQLKFAGQPGTIVSKASLTDDPIVNPTWLFEIPVGTKVTILAYEDWKDHWAYIETVYNGKPVRGFINKIRVRAD